MGRNIKSAKLDTRSARLGLKPNKNPYWVLLGRNEYLGYRKGKTGGVWVARIRSEDDKYKFHSLGVADDTQDANDVTVFNFYQAQKIARDWIDQAKLNEVETGKAKYLINDALDDYIDYLQNHGKSAERAEYSIRSYIRPTFGKLLPSELTSKKISDWHKKLAENKPRVRSSGIPKYRDIDVNDPEYLRKRKSSANRILTILKAALNRAYQHGYIHSDSAWRRVKPFRNAEKPKVDYLEQDKVSDLLSACDPDFKKLVQAALYTGCRYGELISLRVQDYHSFRGIVRILESKSGKPRNVSLSNQGKDFFDHLTMGKDRDALVFTRADYEPWKKSHQTRRLKEACEKAQIDPPITFHILRHTHASWLAQAGTPMSVIAAQLGNGVNICEKHYAHLSPSYIADTIRERFPIIQ